MKKIYLIYDYKYRFGSKYDSIPYRSGLNKNRLVELFQSKGYEVKIIGCSDIAKHEHNPNDIYLYTSSEDKEAYYKSFIEDCLFYLETSGTTIIPRYELLKAHNNKVFMELLRNKYGHLWGDLLKSTVYGTREEVMEQIDQIKYPIVLKKSAGAMSRGVFLARHENELKKYLKKVSKSNRAISFWNFKEIVRQKKHKGYTRESLYRSKFILQPFIKNLKNDWKVLLYGDILFILTRHVKKGDFRASGSHYNYFAGSKSVVPDGLFDFAYSVKNAINVPHLSLDIVYDGSKFHIVEFQAIYFGTSTINLSDVYYKKEDDKWISKKSNLSVEELYVYGVHHFLSNI